MSLSHSSWVTIAWSTSVPIVVFFAALAMYLCWRANKDTELTVDSFITARNSVGLTRVAWSFYAGALGSWVITGPANFASYAGIIGLSMYALASGIPIIVIAFFGKVVQDKVPNASSAADFVNWRFGPLAQLYVVILLMFNMSMALLSEYTTMSSLFRDFIDTNDIPIILAISVLTLTYTIYGGLSISIITDQFQGFASVVFAVAISVYIGINFKAPLPTPLTSTLWGTNESGYSAILTMPVSLMAATVFSEAMWQRCWASSTPRALYTGATIAAVAVIVVVFGFGFLGFLAVWGGLTNENTNPNLYLFQVFKSSLGDGTARLDNWAGLVTILAAVTMSQAAVDSLQNGIMATASSYLLKSQPLFMTRFFVAVLNVPLIIVGLRRYNVLQLFLVSNMVCATSALPVAMGLLESLHRIYTGDMMVYSCFISILSVSAFGVQQHWDSSRIGHSIYTGVRYAWYLNGYNWRYFLVAIVSSLAALLVVIVLGLPFTLLNWPGLSPTRLCQSIKDRITGFWHQPRKDEDDVSTIHGNSYSVPGSYSVPIKTGSSYVKPISGRSFNHTPSQTHMAYPTQQFTQHGSQHDLANPRDTRYV